MSVYTGSGFNEQRSAILQGVAFALLATLCWASNFIIPYVLQGYGIAAFMLVRFVLAGVMGASLLPLFRADAKRLRPRQWLTAMGLGVMGYLGYSACIAGGVIYGGPVMIAGFIGAVPVLQALLGNARQRSLRWGQLVLPIGVLCAGLLVINLHTPSGVVAAGLKPAIGAIFSVAAVLVWLCFSVVNQSAMVPLPASATGAWTCLMMIGAGLASLILTPLAWATHARQLPMSGDAASATFAFYGWALGIALMSSLVGAWAWNLASRRLPMVLSGQLIALESVFATLLGLSFNGRLPTLGEAGGLLLILIGTACSVRIILAPAGTGPSSPPFPQ